MKNESEQAAPADWISIVNERGDLDLAFEALEGYDHFHTDTIRGRIRSLQLRPEDAWDYFRKAEERAASFPRSLRNLLRRFYLKVYGFENAIVEESASDGGRPARTEEHLRNLLTAETPNSEIAGQIRTFCRATYLLHQENYEAARNLFLKLLEDSRNRIGDEKATFYLGAASAHRALGETGESDRQMENVCLAIPTLSNTFNMGVYAASVSAVLRLWDREEEAVEWEAFLVRLQIPRKTSDLFQERSRRIFDRSKSLRRIFLF